MELTGLHHVSSITADAPANYGFYTRELGLRLVKKSVNQDDVSAYHLFYADEHGSPGTDLTFFDYAGAPPARPGTGAATRVGLRVPASALAWWSERLASLGLDPSPVRDRAGRASLDFSDPEGHRYALTADDAPGAPWVGGPVPVERGITGLGPMTLTVARLGPTVEVLTEVLGFRRAGEYADPDEPSRQVVVFETGPGGPGAELHLEERPDLPRARGGAGSVHHIALRVPDDAAHAAWQRRLEGLGIQTSGRVDRYYFRSLYFREPGGILYEIATDGPGFATDEDPARLGERLALPPFLESNRVEIERGLQPLETGSGVAAS